MGGVDVRAEQLAMGEVRSRPCPAMEAPSQARGTLLRLLSADPAYVVSPNGDLLLAAGETVIAGRRTEDR